MNIETSLDTTDILWTSWDFYEQTWGGTGYINSGGGGGGGVYAVNSDITIRESILI